MVMKFECNDCKKRFTVHQYLNGTRADTQKIIRHIKDDHNMPPEPLRVAQLLLEHQVSEALKHKHFQIAKKYYNAH